MKSIIFLAFLGLVSTYPKEQPRGKYIFFYMVCFLALVSVSKYIFQIQRDVKNQNIRVMDCVMIQTTKLTAIGMVEIVVLNIYLIGISIVLNVNVLIHDDLFFYDVIFIAIFWHNCKLAEIKDYFNKYCPLG